MSDLTATIILPTTGDRGLLLPYSVGSILRQTVREIELFIIGDGVDESTRATIHELMATDSRIRFFDHPKHPRRGEEYRHAALGEARGEIVAYLCDRDLMLPNHIATLHAELQAFDFAATANYKVSPQDICSIGHPFLPFESMGVPDTPAKKIGAYKLSAVGHTLAAYRNLPDGWRTTPQDQFTDRYMWRQFIAQPGIRILYLHRPTFLYFKRGHYPGLSTLERAKELERWSAIIQDPSAWAATQDEAFRLLLNERHQLRKDRDSKRGPFILIQGKRLLQWIKSIPRKRANRRLRPKAPALW
jgi:glycosyltransferase involved in cell wall biosynthesis